MTNTSVPIDTLIEEYVNEHWNDVLSDLETLVAIPSYREDQKAAPEQSAPFGPGPRAALTAILEIAQRMGFDTTDLDGHLGFADYKGAEGASKQIGIIGHVDVVPAGPGWTVEPYALTRKEGYLMGRGVADDKGPVVVALHAMNLWKQLGITLPYDIRFLFGAAEETGMEDVAYYRERYSDPDFLFTPDAEFPVCYGEKGHYDGKIVSPVMNPETRAVIHIEGGTAPNAVPGSAFALVKCENPAALTAADRITVTDLGDGTARIDAAGKCQHASIPEGGINAIGLLVQYLLDNNLCNSEERAFFELEMRLLGCTDGSGFGCNCADADFGDLTMVGGMISTDECGRFEQTVDSRFPTSITVDELEERIRCATCKSHASLWRTSVQEPFLMDPTCPEVQTLLNAYNSATGENAQPFTMGGGTYARMFSKAASFGPEKPWIPVPEWVGGMHSPDEGISEESLKEALAIYARVLIGF